MPPRARIDLAGGTLDLWPLHVLHPGSVTVNLAIDLRARCRVRPGPSGFRITVPGLGYERVVHSARELLGDPRAALAGALLEALEIRAPREIELSSDVPYGSGLGGSSALAVAMAGALSRSAEIPFESGDRVAFLRDGQLEYLERFDPVEAERPPSLRPLWEILVGK